MRHADKMHKCAFLGNVRVVSSAHRTSEDRMASHGKPGYGRNARERADFMATLEQHASQPAAHIAGAAREEDGLALDLWHLLPITLQSGERIFRIARIAEIPKNRRDWKDKNFTIDEC
jgi:hypothetical protein